MRGSNNGNPVVRQVGHIPRVMLAGGTSEQSVKRLASLIFFFWLICWEGYLRTVVRSLDRIYLLAIGAVIHVDSPLVVT